MRLLFIDVGTLGQYCTYDVSRNENVRYERPHTFGIYNGTRNNDNLQRFCVHLKVKLPEYIDFF